jgi:hypothetical protein
MQGRGKVITGFWWGNLWERNHLEDPGIVGRMILRWILRKWDGDMIDMAQDRGWWQALVNTVMNFRFHKMQGISLVAGNHLASQEGLCAME